MSKTSRPDRPLTNGSSPTEREPRNHRVSLHLTDTEARRLKAKAAMAGHTRGHTSFVVEALGLDEPAA